MSAFATSMRNINWKVPVGVGSARVCSGVEQHPNRFQVPVTRCPMKCRITTLFSNVVPGANIQQVTNNIGVPPRSGAKQSRFPDGILPVHVRTSFD
jgi:hypothetical protein